MEIKWILSLWFYPITLFYWLVWGLKKTHKILSGYSLKELHGFTVLVLLNECPSFSVVLSVLVILTCFEIS